MLGSMSINIGVTSAAFIALLVVWLIVDLPDVQVVPLTVVGVAVCVGVPLLFFPFAKTIWTFFDLAMHGYDRSYLDPDEARRIRGDER